MPKVNSVFNYSSEDFLFTITKFYEMSHVLDEALQKI